MDKIEELLTRGVEEVIDKEHLLKLLKSKKKLRVKLGIDPTSPNIHIGRAVVLWKLRAFQELGHKVIFIVGDSTGLIGDTSDKDSERPRMSEAEIKKNIKTYFAQAYKILDKKNSETHYNSKWLKKLGFKEMGELADLFGLHEFEARENIARRLKDGKRVSVRELLYPLMQGYDSVAVKADVELGGTDQKFNLLAGRKIQKAYGQSQQDILITTLMEGTDGRKMSSSWGNVINITDEPNEMFGKVMSISDDLIKKYFVLATNLLLDEIERVVEANLNPRDQKAILAQTIVGLYHGENTGTRARQNFKVKYSPSPSPSPEPEMEVDYELNKSVGNYPIVDLLVEGKLASSKSEARRKVREGAVEVDGVRIGDEKASVDIVKGTLIRLGKRFLRIK